MEPKTKADQDKMTAALIKLAAEDPSFRFSRDEESGQNSLAAVHERSTDEDEVQLRLLEPIFYHCNQRGVEIREKAPGEAESRESRHEIPGNAEEPNHVDMQHQNIRFLQLEKRPVCLAEFSPVVGRLA